MTTQPEKTLKWFNFSQNNSGGYFVENENVCEEVFILASSASDAVRIAEAFCDNSDSCPCCGDRWSFWVEDSDGAIEPSMYGEPISQMRAQMFRNKARLHFADGRIETHIFAAREKGEQSAEATGGQQ